MTQSAIKARATVKVWKKRSPVATWPTGYVHDIVLDDRTLRLPDIVLDVLTRNSTAQNLRDLGYRGASARPGPKENLGSFYTVILRKVEAKFGRSSIVRNYSRSGIRGVQDDPAVKAYFLECVDDLTLKLLRL
jgi:hypothetical protein